MASDLKEDECVPFPHEAHQVLTQEILHVFGAGVLIAVGIGSGLSVLGGLLAGARVVAVASSKPHQKFIEKNVMTWLKEKKIVPGTMLQKPAHLIQYEQKKQRGGGAPSPAPKPTPKPAPSPPSTPASNGTPSGTPTPAPPATPTGNANGSNGSAPGRNLLSAFGNVAM